jgi:hypothetical protein
MDGIDQAKVMIYQFIEEKVQLAQRCVDLVAGHQTELDTVGGLRASWRPCLLGSPPDHQITAAPGTGRNLGRPVVVHV